MMSNDIEIQEKVSIVNEILSFDIKLLKRKLLIYNLVNKTEITLEDLNIDIIFNRRIIICNNEYNIINPSKIDLEYYTRRLKKYERCYRWLEIKTKIRHSGIKSMDDIRIRGVMQMYSATELSHEDGEVVITIETDISNKKYPRYTIDENTMKDFLKVFNYSIKEGGWVCHKVLKILTKDIKRL